MSTNRGSAGKGANEIPRPSATKLSVGPGGTCALSGDGHAYCWGIALGAKPYGVAPTRIEPGVAFVEVSRDNVHACARTRTGEVWCAGSDEDGRLGFRPLESCEVGPFNDGTLGHVPCSGRFVRVQNLPPVHQVVAGCNRSCSVSRDGSVYCWGMALWGVLGVVVTDPCSCSNAPRKVPGLDNVRALTLGTFFSCALKSDGSVWCWGSNSAGQRGRGDFDDRQRWAETDEDPLVTPTKVHLLDPVVAIAAGSGHACALTARRSDVYCWGANGAGQLGTETREECGHSDAPCSTRPRQVDLPAHLGSIRYLVAGGAATCVLAKGGTPYCWGRYLLPSGREPKGQPAWSPREIMAGPVSALALSDDHTCAADELGRISCWGTSPVPNQLGFSSKPGDCEGYCEEPATLVEGMRLAAPESPYP